MTDDDEIRTLIARWHEATAAGNVAAVLPLMAEDVVFLVPGQPPMRGRDAFATGLHGVLDKMRIQSRGEVQEIQISGDLAYCWTQLAVEMRPRESGAPVQRAGPTLTVLRKGADGRWVVFRDANLLTVQPSKV